MFLYIALHAVMRGIHYAVIRLQPWQGGKVQISWSVGRNWCSFGVVVFLFKMKGRQEGKEIESVGKLQDSLEYFVFLYFVFVARSKDKF